MDVSKETVDAVKNILSLKTSPSSIAGAISNTTNEEFIDAALGYVSVIETFASMFVKTSPYIGIVISSISLYRDWEKIEEEKEQFGITTDSTTLSTIADAIGLLAAIASTTAISTTASPVNLATYAIGMVGAATISIWALFQGDSTEISEAVAELIGEAQALAAEIGEELMDVVEGTLNLLHAGTDKALEVMDQMIEELNDIGHWVGMNAPLPHEISAEVNEWFQRALDWEPPKDPLVLDLDGDGIETTPADGSVLFDHNGDGIKQATGWIQGDDGLLVLDRNGNGFVDSGRELFGDQTLLSGGQQATDGFSALADLDDDGNGQIDVNDAVFSDLRVWQDRNGDGVSQANELATLSELGIDRLQVDGTPTLEGLGGGNQASAIGSFIWANGEQGESQAGTTANVDLTSNGFYREFTDSIPIPESLRNLPNMRGSGAVRDLSEAAALSPVLTATLVLYSSFSTRQQQIDNLDTLLAQWASTGEFTDFIGRLEQVQLPADLRAAFDDSIAINPLIPGQGRTDSTLDLLAKVRILEAFNNRELISYGFDIIGTASTGGVMRLTVHDGSRIGMTGIEMGSNLATLILSEDQFNFGADQIYRINQAYDALKQSVYEGLLFQTRLKPYLDSIHLGMDGEGLLALDYSAMDSRIDHALSSDSMNGFVDLIELIAFKGDNLVRSGWHIDEIRLKDAIGALSETDRQILQHDHEIALHSGSEGIAVQLGDETINVSVNGTANDRIEGAGSADILMGGDGGDLLEGLNGDDVLFGEAGDDLLRGDHGNDVLMGGLGDDSLEGDQGDDILDGGIGSDVLVGGQGSDRYRFRLGDGQDRIHTHDTTEDREDVLELGEGIHADEVKLQRQSHDLILSLGDGTDQITIANFFYQESPTYGLTSIVFTDGTRWDYTDILDLAIQGTNESDDIQGYSRSDTINGAMGDDRIWGRAGNDTLYGERGNDQLYGDVGNDVMLGGLGDDRLDGEQGNDVFEGGEGDDVLLGGQGDDTYLFGLGDGHDTVHTRDDNPSRRDVLEFKTGIAAEDIRLIREGADLHLIIKPTDDQVTVSDFFRNEDPSYGLTDIQFADGRRWSYADVWELVQQGSDEADRLFGYNRNDLLNGESGDDVLYGGNGDDHLQGGMGNDRLFGELDDDYLQGNGGNDRLEGGGGDDLLDGGAGNDVLVGGMGNDRYLFGVGDGRDRIHSSDATIGRQDRLIFDDGITAEDVTIFRDGNHLEMVLNDSGDEISVYNFFYNENPNYALTDIQWGDGSSWDYDFILERVQQGSDQADHLYGYQRDDQLSGEAGNDLLEGRDGNDVLYGESGNDRLIGNQGDDRLFGGVGDDRLEGSDGDDFLVGGLGNDLLIGQKGNDIYQFSLGDGQDKIQNHNQASDAHNSIVFNDIGVNDLWFSRVGYHLVIDVVGTNDQVIVDRWFANEAHQLDEIQVGELALVNHAVEQMVSAMAAFDVPEGLGSIVPSDVQNQLQPIITSLWQPSEVA